jgi:hypothetical protein
MYCPGCGTETTQGLNYCKQCGASLASAPSAYRMGTPPAWLVLSFLALIGLIGAIGLAGPLAGSTDLRRNGFAPREIIVICSVVMSGAVLMIAFLSKLFFRLLSMYTEGQPGQAVKSLSRTISPRRIGPPPQGIASVTEQTTRSFDLPDVEQRAQ